MTLFMGIAVYGAVLMAMSQDLISDTSTQVREVLLPTARLFEQARNEIDLQIQEISLFSQKEPSKAVGPQNIGLLRLGPSVRSLINLRNSPFLTARIGVLYQPWFEAADSYQQKVNANMTASQSLMLLQALRQKTHLVYRAVDREFSYQLLNLAEFSQKHLFYWMGALILMTVLCLVFALLLWKWMKPIGTITRWIEANSRATPDRGTERGVRPPPPPIPSQSSLFSPPQEIRDLLDALRFHGERFRDQARELEFGAQKNSENEKAIATLFSASLYLSRHNEELLTELIKKERLASMGEMAAQLAHEIRNPLNSLNLKLELLGEELSDDHRRQLENVQGEIDRLNNLTEEHLLRTRAHLGGQADPLAIDRTIDVDLDHDVRTSVEMVLETLKPELAQAQIDVRFENKLSNPKVPVPLKVLQAVLHNLIKNAREAIEDADRTDTPRSILITAFGDNTHWAVEVNDTGCGFPNQFVLSEDNFKSTKRQGFGIGLATSQKMLKRWNARLSVHAGLWPYASTVRLQGERKVEKIVPALPPLPRRERDQEP